MILESIFFVLSGVCFGIALAMVLMLWLMYKWR